MGIGFVNSDTKIRHFFVKSKFFIHEIALLYTIIHVFIHVNILCFSVLRVFLCIIIRKTMCVHAFPKAMMHLPKFASSFWCHRTCLKTPQNRRFVKKVAIFLSRIKKMLTFVASLSLKQKRRGRDYIDRKGVCHRRFVL